MIGRCDGLTAEESMMCFIGSASSIGGQSLSGICSVDFKADHVFSLPTRNTISYLLGQCILHMSNLGVMRFCCSRSASFIDAYQISNNMRSNPYMVITLWKFVSKHNSTERSEKS
jgi:hypothetical protein